MFQVVYNDILAGGARQGERPDGTDVMVAIMKLWRNVAVLVGLGVGPEGLGL